ncbi:hypothetical protein MP31_25335 [Escherichia coli N36254PS]|nr:hypothetical protein MP33_11345 [Escherichia coli N37058PS]OMI53890.1 hypothetical protein MP34_07915 [Escherichia coli N37122PS]OMI59496.1 hypothetical protein Q676_02925 [Escherichia coli N40607]OMI62228.1 hypothetical protein MP31_25335 [Escherichia coli N36254PS]QBP89245.1 hypothetical protein FORC81_4482 [Escherichia coli]
MVKHHAPHKEAVVTARYGLYITQLIPLAILLFKLSN